MRKILCTLALASLTTLGCDSDEGDTSDVEGGTFRIIVSGEELAVNGYDFPPNAGQEVYLVDGWELSFERALVAIGSVHLNEDPDVSPTDQSQVGAEVAELAGVPFVVDVANGGEGTVAGKGAGVRAWELGTIAERRNGKAFDPAKRYALSFGFTSASDDATIVGFEAEDEDYARMVDNGWTHLLIGTATRQRAVSDCETTGDFDYEELPTEVHFEFGFTAAAENVNCQNPELTGQPISEAEESQRGVQAKANEVVDVQLTVHTDHLFWNTFAHGATPQFNQFAALAVEEGGRWVVTLEELEGAPLVGPAQDDAGNDLGWMSCVSESEYQLLPQPIFTFDSEGQDVASVHDFVIANASTMGHLNQDGLCFVEGVEHHHH